MIDAEEKGSGSSKKQREKTSCFWFIGDGVSKGLWTLEIEDTAERLGNECRAHQETSVYVNYAAIVYPHKAD
jgi:hypothetical protein